MKFQRRFGERKKSKPKKGMFLVVLLAVALLLYMNAEKILNYLF